MSSEKVGLTTTLPVEVIFAGGYTPVDLNNIFVGEEEAYEIVLDAEKAGFPQNSCAWVKGLYSTARKYGYKKIACVREGDCSQNVALEDIWHSEGIETISFSYPYHRTKPDFEREVASFAKHFSADIKTINEWKVKLDLVRSIAREIDKIAVENGSVTSLELFLSQLYLTDFLGDYNKCKEYQKDLLESVRTRPEDNTRPRIGVLGVPTILTDLSDVIDDLGARVVYHEVPYEFSMIKSIGRDLAETYLEYTYPYSAEIRIKSISDEVKKRRLDGVIHYTQSFCHRQIHDLLMRREFQVPILTIEGDRPSTTDGRTLTRIEAFIEQLG